MAPKIEQLQSNLWEATGNAFARGAVNIKDIVANAALHTETVAQGLTQYERLGIEAGVSPFPELLTQIAAAQASLTELTQYIEKLRTHRCDWDNNDICTICGSDGRA
jgi:hypothetical protein